jgi:hypothetical protein
MTAEQADAIAVVAIPAFVVSGVALTAWSKRARYLFGGMLIACLIALLMGCKPKDVRVVAKPETVKVEAVRYVRIPEALTAPLPKPTGSLDQAVDVAKKRGDVIDACNGRLSEIGAIEGTKPC